MHKPGNFLSTKNTTKLTVYLPRIKTLNQNGHGPQIFEHCNSENAPHQATTTSTV